MIQLNDIYKTVINPLHIIYFNVSSNPLEPDFKELSKLTGQMTTIVIEDKEFTIIAEIKCRLHGVSFRSESTFKYACVDNFKSDYLKLLNATNA